MMLVFPFHLYNRSTSILMSFHLPALFCSYVLLLFHHIQVGITDGFVRISVGLEDIDDLIAALAKVLETL